MGLTINQLNALVEKETVGAIYTMEDGNRSIDTFRLDFDGGSLWATMVQHDLKKVYKYQIATIHDPENIDLSFAKFMESKQIGDNPKEKELVDINLEKLEGNPVKDCENVYSLMIRAINHQLITINLLDDLIRFTLTDIADCHTDGVISNVSSFVHIAADEYNYKRLEFNHLVNKLVKYAEGNVDLKEHLTDDEYRFAKKYNLYYQTMTFESVSEAYQFYQETRNNVIKARNEIIMLLFQETVKKYKNFNGVVTSETQTR